MTDAERIHHAGVMLGTLLTELEVLRGPYHGREKHSAEFHDGWNTCADKWVLPVLRDALFALGVQAKDGWTEMEELLGQVVGLERRVREIERAIHTYADACERQSGEATAALELRRLVGRERLNITEPVPLTPEEMHARQSHPDYEYATTEGPRKAPWHPEPPYDETGRSGWKRNVYRGDQGWDRFDYHEEAYWMRRRSQ